MPMIPTNDTVDIVATVVASLALLISVISFVWQRRSFTNGDMPELVYEAMSYDTTKVSVYTNNPDWAGTRQKSSRVHAMGKEERDFIERGVKSVTVQYYKHKPYMFINICDTKEDAASAKAVLLLDILEIEIGSVEAYANELNIQKAYSAISGTNDVYKQARYNMRLYPRRKGDSRHYLFRINVAYACCGDRTSINIKKIKQILEDNKPQKGNLLTPDHNAFLKGSDIISFYDSAYWFKCQGKSGRRYSYTLHMTVDQNSGDFHHKFLYGRKHYFQALWKMWMGGSKKFHTMGAANQKRTLFTKWMNVS